MSAFWTIYAFIAMFGPLLAFVAVVFKAIADYLPGGVLSPVGIVADVCILLLIYYVAASVLYGLLF